jgi:hypothetical protein
MLAKVVDGSVDVSDVLEVEEGSDGGFRGGTEQRVEDPGHHLARVCAQPVRGRVWRWKSAKHVEKFWVRMAVGHPFGIRKTTCKQSEKKTLLAFDFYLMALFSEEPLAEWAPPTTFTSEGAPLCHRD